VRRQSALSSQELTDLFRSIPASKQVLVFDTCASGRLVEKLTENRSVSSSQKRALDRLQERMGMHVLAGCAADAVSYEATRYGQGVLTYSLRLGMQGEALREDQFVDVRGLFEFAADRVPKLAGNVGGIQKPELYSPQGSGSFDIGQLTAADRVQIPLQSERPLVLRSQFQEKEMFADVLELSKHVNELLRTADARSPAESVVFVDAGEQIPGSYLIAGQYQIKGDEVTANVNLFHDKRAVHRFTIAGRKSDPEELAARIVAAVDTHLAAKVGNK
jgi:hypothetical protein